MDDSRLLQESNLTARVPHHVIHATVSDGLVQGPYVVTSVGFELMTLRTQGTELTTEPPFILDDEAKFDLISLLHAFPSLLYFCERFGGNFRPGTIFR